MQGVGAGGMIIFVFVCFLLLSVPPLLAVFLFLLKGIKVQIKRKILFSISWMLFDILVTIPLILYWPTSGFRNEMNDGILLSWKTGLTIFALSNFLRAILFMPSFIRVEGGWNKTKGFQVLASVFFVPIVVLCLVTIPSRNVSSDKDTTSREVFFKGTLYQVRENGALYSKTLEEKEWHKGLSHNLYSPHLTIAYGHLYLLGISRETGFYGSQSTRQVIEVTATGLVKLPEKEVREIFDEFSFRKLPRDINDQKIKANIRSY